MSQAFNLFRLQQVDTQINRVNARLEAIQKSLNEHPMLDQALHNRQVALEESNSCKSAQAKAEQEVEALKIKIDQIQSSLYGDKGHSPKELMDLQNDLGSLRKHLITLENILLDAMLSFEEAANLYNNAQIIAEQTKQALDNENSELLSEQITQQKDLAKLLKERAAIAEAIPSQDLDTYDELRLKKKGLAVVTIVEGSCSACGTGLTPAMIQSSRTTSSLIICPSCSRILYGN